jgi:hypothetical protein
MDITERAASFETMEESEEYLNNEVGALREKLSAMSKSMIALSESS